MFNGDPMLLTKQIEEKELKITNGLIKYDTGHGTTTQQNHIKAQFAKLEGIATSGAVWYDSEHNILVLDRAVITGDRGMSKCEPIRLSESTIVVVNGFCQITAKAGINTIFVENGASFYSGYFDPNNRKVKTEYKPLLQVNAHGSYSAIMAKNISFYGLTIAANSQCGIENGDLKGYSSLLFSGCEYSNPQGGKLIQGFTTVSTVDCGIDPGGPIVNYNVNGSNVKYNCVIYSGYKREFADMGQFWKNNYEFDVRKAKAIKSKDFKITKSGAYKLDINLIASSDGYYTDDNDVKFWPFPFDYYIELPFSTKITSLYRYIFTKEKLAAPTSLSNLKHMALKLGGRELGGRDDSDNGVYFLPETQTIYMRNYTFSYPHPNNNAVLFSGNDSNKDLDIVLEGNNKFVWSGTFCSGRFINIVGVNENASLDLDIRHDNNFGILAKSLQIKDCILNINSSLACIQADDQITMNNVQSTLTTKSITSLKVSPQKDSKSIIFSTIKCGVKRTAANNNLMFDATAGMFKNGTTPATTVEIVRTGNYMKLTNVKAGTNWTMKQALEDEKKPKIQVAQ